MISKQLMRCTTSVGANVREAQNAESTKDFIHKMAIAQKEADESNYWLEILLATEYLAQGEFESMEKDAIELLKIIRSIILTKRKNI